MQCLIDGWHGTYVPQEFALLVQSGEFTIVQGINDDALSILRAGPDNPEYWDVWDYAVDEVLIEDRDGRRYWLFEDGDLYIVDYDGEELDFDEYNFPEFMQEAE